MKKSLIALAVLAASGAALAQSSVTVYGRVDVSVGSVKNTVTGLSTSRVSNGSEAGLTSSRWGLTGTEDLGGGLKAVFKLENRFNADSGTDTSGFSGDAYVGLTGGFGTVHAGLATTAYDGVAPIALSSNVFDSAFTPAGNVYSEGLVANYSGRVANTVKYVSPMFGGFGFAASYSTDEGAATKADVGSIAASYTAGPLKVGVGFQDQGAADYTVVSGSYNFGVASVSAGYQLADNAALEDKEFTIGVNVPVGAWNFSAGYARTKSENAGVAGEKASGFGLGATYSLSKRTTVYAAYEDIKVKTAAGVKDTGSQRMYAVGLRHDF